MCGFHGKAWYKQYCVYLNYFVVSGGTLKVKKVLLYTVYVQSCNPDLEGLGRVAGEVSRSCVSTKL